MTTFYCLRFKTPPTWRARSPYLYPPGTVRPGYTTRNWVPFLSLSTTHRATFEVFDPTSTQDYCRIKSKSKSHCDWQSICKSWCPAPSGAHDQIFITLWQLRSCFCGTPSLTSGRVRLFCMLLALASLGGGLNISHHPQQFLYYSGFIRCCGNVC
jgi:hypothetical protein